MTAIVVKDSSVKRIRSMLKSADKDFIPPLSDRLDIEEYSRKLADHAINIFLVINGLDSGHAAFYANDKSTFRAYLTSFYVSPGIRGKGYAVVLMDSVISICKEFGMLGIELEVSSNNKAALALYKKIGFEIVKSGPIKHMYVGW